MSVEPTIKESKHGDEKIIKTWPTERAEDAPICYITVKNDALTQSLIDRLEVFNGKLTIPVKFIYYYEPHDNFIQYQREQLLKQPNTCFFMVMDQRSIVDYTILFVNVEEEDNEFEIPLMEFRCVIEEFFHACACNYFGTLPFDLFVRNMDKELQVYTGVLPSVRVSSGVVLPIHGGKAPRKQLKTVLPRYEGADSS